MTSFQWTTRSSPTSPLGCPPLTHVLPICPRRRRCRLGQRRAQALTATANQISRGAPATQNAVNTAPRTTYYVHARRGDRSKDARELAGPPGEGTTETPISLVGSVASEPITDLQFVSQDVVGEIGQRSICPPGPPTLIGSAKCPPGPPTLIGSAK